MQRRAHLVIQAMKLSGLDFSGVEDRRRSHRKVHALPSMFRLLVLACAVLKPTFRAAEDLGADLSATARKALGIGRPPSDTTLSQNVRSAEEAGFAEALYNLLKKALELNLVRNDLLAAGMLSVDGKAGANGVGPAPNAKCHRTVHDKDGSPCWFTSVLRGVLCSSSAAPCLAQQPIPAGTGEHVAFIPLLKSACEEMGGLFRYVSCDAGLTSKENVAAVRSLGKHYVAAIKRNHPGIFNVAIDLLRTAPLADVVMEQHGDCHIYRTLRRVRAPADCAYQDARQLWQVEHYSINVKKGTIQHYGVRFFLVSIPWEEVGDEDILPLVRLHWAGSENRANWTADMVLREDTHVTSRSGNGPQICAWLSVLAYNLLALFRWVLSKEKRTPERWKRVAEVLRDVLVMELDLATRV